MQTTSLRRELQKGMEHIPDDIHAIESLANTQREEITKTHMKSQELMTQISTLFEEMHQFLRQREEEIKNELKEKKTEAVEEMTEKFKAMDLALSESRELQVKVTAALEISDSLKFLQSWTEMNNMLTPECLFRPRANDLQVARTSLSLGPYESHLQFFVWKEMLQVVKPRAELLLLRRESTDVTVSDDGRSLLSAPKSSQSQPGVKSDSHLYHTFGSARARSSLEYRSMDAWAHPEFGSTHAPSTFGRSSFSGWHDNNSFAVKTKHAFSVNEFSSGQHYWETEVGLRNYWELGVKGHFLKYDGQKYVISNQSSETELTFTDRPRKDL
ncbi:nuclear factor 7, brain-like [Myripristis murdjan]|uniref:nuclear factor 7, brain-like n=1 Tax=Myripristis murdjan TaxID=586833 RepID=UPI001175F2D5|nr:nuclear factor 7, brain-like [Myripristis murdjan]